MAISLQLRGNYFAVLGNRHSQLSVYIMVEEIPSFNGGIMIGGKCGLTGTLFAGTAIWLSLVSSIAAPNSWAQETKGELKALTVERIYSLPNLGGSLAEGLSWTPDGSRVSFFEPIKITPAQSGFNPNPYLPKTEAKKLPSPNLWIMDASSGERRILVPSEKLETILPAGPSGTTQATGLGRHASGKYQWAPDGGAILFEGPHALAWYGVKSGEVRTLVTSKEVVSDPKISPDGRWVSFVRDHNIWLVSVSENAKESKARALTQGGTEEIRKGELDWVYPEELGSKTAYWWASDSSAVAYFEMNESKVAQYPLVEFSAFDGDAEMERYPPAGGANPVVRVFVCAVNGGNERQIDTGADSDVYIPRVNWLPDSKHLAIQRLNRAQTVLDLILADTTSGKSRVALTDKDQYWINVSDDLNFLRDGRFLWSSERSGYRHIYLYDQQGKQLAQLTKGDWEVTGIEGVDEAKGMVYFTATEKSPLERHLYRIGLDGSSFSRVTKDAGTHQVKLPVNRSGGIVSFLDTYSKSGTPPRQDLTSVDGNFIAAVSENKVAELENYRLSPTEFVSVKTHDGVDLNASIIKPPNFNPQRRYPVLVYTYGGPQAQVVTDAWGGNTFLWHEFMAQQGYIIFAVDNRGSAGRGHLFEEPIHYRFGAQELSDQRDGAIYLRSLAFVDPKRIGIWGWSYGGHMTLHAMFEAPDDFKVGFAGGPVTDWHYYDSIYTERYIGLLPVNEEYYQESSPIQKAGQLKGKLLIAHGTGDDNVHFANTLALLDALIEDGKYVEVMPFPGRGHGISDLPARRLLMERVTRFFLDNL